jgi:hypothetical protein
VSHGSEITVLAQLTTGAYVTLAEAYEVDFDEDQSIVAVPVLGSRRTGYRQGRYKIVGTLKVYWVNQAVRAMMVGSAPVTGGNTTPLYHSQRPFNRFNIAIQSQLAAAPTGVIINAVFEKDAIKWGEAALAEETIAFTAEDYIAQ